VTTTTPFHFAGEPPFVGRTRERHALETALDQACAGVGSTVLVSGAAGAGKTRLVRELSRAARDRGIPIVWGHCEEQEGAPAYWPWPRVLQSLLRDIAQATGATQPLAGDLAVVAQVMPEIALTAGVSEPPVAPPAEPSRFRLLESVRELVASAGNQTPLVIVLDDLHRAGEPAMLLFQHLAQATATMPVLLIGTFRDEDAPAALRRMAGDLAREPRVARIELRGLESTDVGRFLELATGARATNALTTACYLRTGGNPFFLTEVVRALQQREDAGGRQDAVALPAQLPIPGAVREMLLRRIERLSPRCLLVMEAAAVLGRDFDLPLLRALLVQRDANTTHMNTSPPASAPPEIANNHANIAAPMTDIELLEALDEAEQAGMILHRDEGAGQYQFVHALVREVVYSFLPSARRARLHEAVVTTLLRRHGPLPEPVLSLLAHHARLGVPIVDVAGAAGWLQRAATFALKRLAYEEAAVCCINALELLARWQPGDQPPRRAFLLTLGEAQRRAGDLDAALETFVEAASAAREDTPDPISLVRAALGYEDALLPTARPRAGLDDPSIQLLQEAMSLLPEHETVLATRVDTALARALHFAGAPAGDTIALSDRAVAGARSSGDAAALAYALNTRRMLSWGPDHLPQRLGLASDLVLAATSAGDLELTQEGRTWRIRALLEAGDLAAALPDIAAYRRDATELRQPFHLAFAALWEGTRAVLEARWDAAETLAGEAQGICARLASRELEAGVTARLFVVYRETGQWERLATLVPAIRSLADDYPMLPGWRAMLALALLDLGNEHGGRVEFQRLAAGGFAGMPRDWLWLTAMAFLAEVCSILSDRTHARALYDLLLPYATHNPTAVDCLGSCARFLGQLAITIGDYTAARAHYESALASDLRLGARPWLAHSSFEYARLLFDQQGPDSVRAQDLLGQAGAIAAESGMTPLLRQTGSFKQYISGVGVPADTAGQPSEGQTGGAETLLTRREIEVLRLVAAGKSNPEIAAALTISPHTAVRHVSNIFAKLGASTRAEAAACAVRLGLLT
jgi:DNA-binding CsgD family transcriptional regulator/tetratricopeptide (TPR) repeat protein